jgi:multiple sugar transport system substrate-binding protein
MVVRASQFAAEAKRLPAFEEATGIKVTFVDIPFVAMREKLTAEMIAGSTDFDLVTPIDVWIPPLVDTYLAPLKQGLGKHGIDPRPLPGAVPALRALQRRLLRPTDPLPHPAPLLPQRPAR